MAIGTFIFLVAVLIARSPLRGVFVDMNYEGSEVRQWVSEPCRASYGSPTEGRGDWAGCTRFCTLLPSCNVMSASSRGDISAELGLLSRLVCKLGLPILDDKFYRSRRDIR